MWSEKPQQVDETGRIVASVKAGEVTRAGEKCVAVPVLAEGWCDLSCMNLNVLCGQTSGFSSSSR
jgi:hypothetical protein